MGHSSNHNDPQRSGLLFTFMPQRQMDKTKSKYEFWQWLKLARAINKLKADIGLKIGALQERVAMNGEISELIQELKVASEDLNALTLQMSYVDEEMAKDLENP